MRKTLAKIITTVMVGAVLQIPVFAGNGNGVVISNRSTFVNEGVTNTAITQTATYNAISSSGNNNAAIIENIDEFYNSGIIGTYVKQASIGNYVDNIGNNNKTAMINDKLTANSGYINTHIDISETINEVLNR